MPSYLIDIVVRMLRALVFKPVSSVFSLSQKLNEVFTVALLIYRVTHLTKTNSILLPSTFLLHINILHKIKKKHQKQNKKERLSKRITDIEWRHYLSIVNAVAVSLRDYIWFLGKNCMYEMVDPTTQSKTRLWSHDHEYLPRCCSLNYSVYVCWLVITYRSIVFFSSTIYCRFFDI